jgi:F-type H+-transporting ATPase subunit alpha
VNVGLSVSRVGGSAQLTAMKDVAGTLKLTLATFRELQAFSAFGSDLDEATRKQLNRGARLVELLKQDQYSPVPMELQIIQIVCGTEGVYDDVAVADVRRFISDLTGHFEKHPLTVELRANLTAKFRAGGPLREKVLAEARQFRSLWK